MSRQSTGKKVCVYLTDSLADAGAVPKATRDKIEKGTAVAADLVGSGKLIPSVDPAAAGVDTNRLLFVDDISEYGRTTASNPENPYCDPSYSVPGAETIDDLTLVMMPDIQVDAEAKWITVPNGTAVAGAVVVRGDAKTDAMVDAFYGVLGGVARISNKEGSQRYRRTVILGGLQMGLKISA